ncbi:hypothetical protein ACFSUC_07970 [Marinicrinis sediminis]|uniref:Uncharacterized protein n=1 Tax=Marinicrinis sediminis TaxID=1652465 RepID=A0ABW5R9W5_9BACL
MVKFEMKPNRPYCWYRFRFIHILKKEETQQAKLSIPHPGMRGLRKPWLSAKASLA